MKRIALITDGWDRYVTYAWIEGYRQYTACHDTDMDLYVFQSFGNFSKDGNKTIVKKKCFFITNMLRQSW